jgi:hypothetical protein
VNSKVDSMPEVVSKPVSKAGRMPTSHLARRATNIAVSRAEGISPADPDVVYENGQYVGRDPDPNVRLELRRDWTHD